MPQTQKNAEIKLISGLGVKVIYPSDPSGYLSTTLGRSMKKQRQRRTASTLDGLDRAASRPGRLAPIHIRYSV